MKESVYGVFVEYSKNGKVISKKLYGDRVFETFDDARMSIPYSVWDINMENLMFLKNSEIKSYNENIGHEHCDYIYTWTGKKCITYKVGPIEFVPSKVR